MYDSTAMPEAGTNRQRLEWLFATGQIALERGSLFDYAPGPLLADRLWDRIAGMLVGLAVGDALGNTTEGWLPARRQAVYGEVRDYLPHPATGRSHGLPSDDSQLAFWTLEQLLADGGLEPDHLAARFCRDRIFGIGGTVREFVVNYRERGLPWYMAGPRSAGNGALMRIAPLLLPHLRSGTSDVWADVALAALITHNDPASLSACLAFAHLLWRLLAMDAPPPASWWLDTYVTVARELEGETRYRPRTPRLATYEGPLWRLVATEVSAAYARDLTAREACDRWYSGAYLLETVPSVLYILMRHGVAVEEAVTRAVNDTKDSDTVAAIVGAAVGALHGLGAIPARWCGGLTGRTTDRDDGQIFALIEEARGRWWS